MANGAEMTIKVTLKCETCGGAWSDPQPTGGTDPAIPNLCESPIHGPRPGFGSISAVRPGDTLILTTDVTRLDELDDLRERVAARLPEGVNVVILDSVRLAAVYRPPTIEVESVDDLVASTLACPAHGEHPHESAWERGLGRCLDCRECVTESDLTVRAVLKCKLDGTPCCAERGGGFRG